MPYGIRTYRVDQLREIRIDFSHNAASGSPEHKRRGRLRQSIGGLAIDDIIKHANVDNSAEPGWSVVGCPGIFRTNLTSNAVIVWPLMSSSGLTVYTATTTGAPVSGYGQVVCVFPVSTIADYLTISITDTSNPDGFINVPLAFCGPSFQPIGSISFDSTTGRNATVAETTAWGGEEYPVLFYQQRTYTAVFDSLRRSEVWTAVDQLSAYSAGGSNVLISPNMTSSYLNQQAVFGRLKPTSDLSYPNAASDRRKMKRDDH